MADVNGIPKIELFDQLVDIGGICVHVIADNSLGGAPVSATVMSDYPESTL
jgi:hypothetical protein